MESTTNKRNTYIELFAISLISLYFELMVIRWLSSEIRIFAYFKNIPLMACLFGLGLGMALPTTKKDLRKFFPIGIFLIVLLITLAEPLHLVHIVFLNPMEHYLIGDFIKAGSPDSLATRASLFIPGLTVLVGVFYLITFTFMSLGQYLGRLFDQLPPLEAYSLNVAASLLGILLFSVVSFMGWPPVVWLLIGVAACLPFFKKPIQIGALALSVVAAFALNKADVQWSPYYRLGLTQITLLADQGHPEAKYGFNVNVNYDAIEGAYNNNPEFLKTLSPKQLKSTADYYDTPYLALGDKPRSILIIAAGTGNDVAAALRHGASEIDAVEIDPKIAEIGKQLHPEKPYDDPRVHIIVDDARAYMRRTDKKYDLVVFGYLDSHTAFSSMSSLRLDNYVYTKESFEDALKLVKPGGAISVTFYCLNWWQLAHVYKALEEGTKLTPEGIFSAMGNGPALIVGEKLDPKRIQDNSLKPFSIAGSSQGWHFTMDDWKGVNPTTDDWPFLFLKDRSVSWTYAIGLLFTLMLGYKLVGACFGKYTADSAGRMMFFLGAAFMLIETKSVTQMGLLLGTTWIVNSAVIASILVMIILANLVQLKARFKNVQVPFACLFGALALNFLLPLSAFNALSPVLRTMTGAFVLALPLFFAAMIFAQMFSRMKDPGKALGMNLLGTLVGGVLEYSSLVIGINALNILAALLYLGALLSWSFWQKQNSGVEVNAQ